MSHRRWNIPADLLPHAPAIAAEYQTGATYLDLADRWEATSNSIAACLRQQGVTPRRRGVSGEKQRERLSRVRSGIKIEGERHPCQIMARLCVFTESDGHCPACEARTRIDAGIHGSSTGGCEYVGAGR